MEKLERRRQAGAAMTCLFISKIKFQFFGVWYDDQVAFFDNKSFLF
jgi:hypothetical protein